MTYRDTLKRRIRLKEMAVFSLGATIATCCALLLLALMLYEQSTGAASVQVGSFLLALSFGALIYVLCATVPWAVARLPRFAGDISVLGQERPVVRRVDLSPRVPGRPPRRRPRR